MINLRSRTGKGLGDGADGGCGVGGLGNDVDVAAVVMISGGKRRGDESDEAEDELHVGVYIDMRGVERTSDGVDDVDV